MGLFSIEAVVINEPMWDADLVLKTKLVLKIRRTGNVLTIECLVIVADGI